MIKCIFLVYRAPHLTREEFAAHWLNKHSKIAIRTAPVARMQRYVQNHARQHPVAEQFRQSRGCLLGDFDGVAEVWWTSFEDMIAAASDPSAYGIMQTALADEQTFVDLARSIIWFGEEIPFWPATAILRAAIVPSA